MIEKWQTVVERILPGMKSGGVDRVSDLGEAFHLGNVFFV
jgi:hypothetical protein